MKRFFFFTLLFAGAASAQQMPYFPVDNYAPTSGAQTIAAPFGMVAPTNVATPVTVSQTAQINFVAGTRLALHPGFSAGSFSGNGYFHGQIGTAPDFEVVFIEPNQNTPYVGQFEKLEMGVRLPAVIEQRVNDFLANTPGGLNPFDPEQISIEANFTNGVNSHMVYGFYYDEFIRDPNAMVPFAPANWITQATDYHWRIRFAPPSVGNWYCTVSIRLNNALGYAYAVNGLYFQCIPSSNEGWLEKGNNNWYLRYSGSNHSFFALGQNISWNDLQSFYGGSEPDPNYPVLKSGYLDILDRIISLSDNGGNMVRSVNVGNAYELELTRLGNYADRMDRAWELDRLFELCEQRNMKVSMQCANLRFGDESGNFGWYDNPYHTQIPLSDKKDFFTNAIAKSYFIKKLRYFLSRWGYSTSLGILAVSGEIDGHFNNYKNDHTLQENQTIWHNDLLGFAKSLMDYRSLLTTTSYTSAIRGSDYHRNANFQLRTPFDLDMCDITTMHTYHAERRANLMRLDEFEEGGFNPGLHTTWKNKPTYFEELGIATNPDGLGADPDDLYTCSDVTYHNDLWATSFMGGLGTGFNWWQPNNNAYRSANFPPVKAFFDDINFEATAFEKPDFWDDHSSDDHKNSTIETYYIRNKSGSQIIGWVHNPTNYWGNIILNCMDRHNNNPDITKINDDDQPASPQPIPTHTKYEIHGVNNLENFTFQLYHTRFPGGLYSSTTEHSNIFGTLKPEFETGPNDWAYKAFTSGHGFRTDNQITTDTLLCSDDTVEVIGNYVADTLETMHYHWNFGNGQISEERNTTVIYTEPGTYLVTLIVSDSTGWADTLQQYIVKPEPCVSARRAEYANFYSPTWNIYPNPTNTNLAVVFDSTWAENVTIELYSMDGNLVITHDKNTNESIVLSVLGLRPGFYFLIAKDKIHLEVKKVVIER